jgi:hypothetical protein
MTLASIVAMLQTILVLIATVQANPSLPQSARDSAVIAAQSAIAQATAALASQQTKNVSMPTLSPSVTFSLPQTGLTYEFGTPMSVSWSATNIKDGTRACVTLVSESGQQFAFPPNGGGCMAAGSNGWVTGTPVRTSGYNPLPGKYYIQVTFTGPSVGGKDGPVLHTAKSGTFTLADFIPVTISPAAPTCTITHSASSISKTSGLPLHITWSSTGATSRSYTVTRPTYDVPVYGPQSISTNGSMDDMSYASLPENGTYIRNDTVTGPGGTGTCQVTLNVF